MTMSITESSSPMPSNAIIGGVDVGYDPAIKAIHAGSTFDYSVDEELSQFSTSIPCSLLVKHSLQSKQHQNHQLNGPHAEILNIVRGILQLAAAAGDQQQKQRGDIEASASFLSPMKKSPRSLDASAGLLALSLDEDSDSEEEENEDWDALMVAAADTQISEQPAPLSERKRVRFAPSPSIEYTISRADITDEEKRSYWLQDEEFGLIRLRDGYLGTLAEEQQRKMAAVAKSTGIIPPQSYSIPISPQHWIYARGLEFKMKLGFLKTQSKRLEYLERVLIEQERQWDEHWDNGRNYSPFVYDEESFADVCDDLTRDCKTHAIKVAANDRREVDELLHKEEEIKRMKQ